VTSGGTVDEIAEAARLAEQAGFDSAWASDFHDRSATVALAAMALRTSTIELGSGIAYAFGRTPLVLAAEARDLDELSGGRLILGLGTGTRRMQQDWHGLDGEHPASRMEELVPLLRRLWRLDEGPVEHEGRFYRLRVRPTAPVRAALRPEIPVYMAGVNPRMIEAAGAVADGLVGHPLFTADYVREVARPALDRGAARAGRSGSVPIAGFVNCCVDEDGERARRDAAAMIAFNSTVKTYDAIHRLHGWEQEVEAIRRSWRAGDWAAMVDAVPGAMVESIAVAGTPREVRDQLLARAGLYERTLLWPPGFRGLEGVRAVLGAFASPHL
jgi:probable F420-dependent oxidoreductase